MVRIIEQVSNCPAKFQLVSTVQSSTMLNAFCWNTL